MPRLSARDRKHLLHAIELAARSRAEGHHPFAAMVVAADGTLLAEAFNSYLSDCTGHAEVSALRLAWGRQFDPAADSERSARRLAGATLYCSAEPCAMCAGAAYWSGIGRVVYALSEQRLLALTGGHAENPTLSLPCREVFARGQRSIEVLGPFLEDEAAAVHAGFW
jgi:tRNA(Arg) A34 adenosine deaminase TadA